MELMAHSENIEREDLSDDELWAVVECDSYDPFVALFRSKRRAEDAAASTDSGGGSLFHEPAVLPCLLSDGEVTLCNHVDVTTHEQLRKALKPPVKRRRERR